MSLDPTVYGILLVAATLLAAAAFAVGLRAHAQARSTTIALSRANAFLAYGGAAALLATFIVGLAWWWDWRSERSAIRGRAIVAGKLSHPDATERHLAALRAGVRGIREIDTLRDRLEDPDAGVRAAAAWALGQMSPHAARVAPAIAARLLDDDVAVTEQAGQALATLGGPAIAPLRAALETGEGCARESAALGLCRIVGRGQSVVLDAAASEDARVRAAALWALGDLGLDAAYGANVIVQGLADPDLEVRSAAVWGCPRILPDETWDTPAWRAAAAAVGDWARAAVETSDLRRRQRAIGVRRIVEDLQTAEPSEAPPR